MSWWPFKQAARPQGPEQVLEAKIASTLQGAGWTFVAHPTAMGLYPGFLVSLDPEHPLVIEAWAGVDESLSLARRRLAHSAAALEMPGLLVTPGGGTLLLFEAGVWQTGLNDLTGALQSLRQLAGQQVPAGPIHA